MRRHSPFPLLTASCAAAWSLAVGSAIAATIDINLWTPRQARPAFVEPDKTFVAEIIPQGAVGPTGWTATLSNAEKTWDCSVTSAVSGTNNLDLGAKSGWRLTVKVRPDISPELYQLNVAYTNGGNAGAASRIQAVSVVPVLDTSFYIIHLTDEHIYNPGRSLNKDGNHEPSTIRMEGIVANIANPRLLLNTGDFSTAMSASRKDEIEKWFLPNTAGYRVPQIMTSGNHDYDEYSDVAFGKAGQVRGGFAPADWENDFGPRSSVIRMNSFYIMAHEFSYQGDKALLKRVQDRYSADYDDPTVTFRMLAQHGMGQSTYFDPVSQLGGKRFDVALLGHDHKTMRKAAFANALVTTSSELWGACVPYTFTYNHGKWICDQNNAGFPTNYDALEQYPYGGRQEYGMRLIRDASAGLVNLSQQFSSANDGTQTTNSSEIANRLKFNWHDGRTRFVMSKGDYQVTGGTKLAQYDADDGQKTVVLVRVDIPKGSADAPAVTTVKVVKKP